jgi:hypothetical protein
MGRPIAYQSRLVPEQSREREGGALVGAWRLDENAAEKLCSQAGDPPQIGLELVLCLLEGPAETREQVLPLGPEVRVEQRAADLARGVIGGPRADAVGEELVGKARFTAGQEACRVAAADADEQVVGDPGLAGSTELDISSPGGVYGYLARGWSIARLSGRPSTSACFTRMRAEHHGSFGQRMCRAPGAGESSGYGLGWGRG